MRVVYNTLRLVRAALAFGVFLVDLCLFKIERKALNRHNANVVERMRAPRRVS